MRAVVQRVSAASVSVNNEVISSISRGIMVLVGIGRDDTMSDVEKLSNKLLALRLFNDASGTMWKMSVKDIEGDVLCVSQFTLLADLEKKRPSFHRAMATEPSQQLYSSFLDKMAHLYRPEKIKVAVSYPYVMADGRFGAMMSVSLINEGPVTFTLDSRKLECIDRSPENSSSSGTKSGAPNDVNAQATDAGHSLQ